MDEFQLNMRCRCRCRFCSVQVNTGLGLLAPRPTLLLSHPGLGPAMAELYLDDKVTTDCDYDDEVTTRISNVNQAVTMPRLIWRSTGLSIHTKIGIFKSNVLIVLLYGSECWKATTPIESKLAVFQNKCLLKIYWPKHHIKRRSQN